ncbi:SAM dependent methyltransferase [Haloferula helveola]|uniref:SAM dependent methyltransferase n=1 Tax=Haloferula helveola TaxID=490095 RepID=A0ABM7RD37_9BACT|nr:SAM dependent methyltransferase [Haloferula helveola]
MGLYRSQIFPRLYNVLMGLGGFDRLRAEHLSTACGEVLEVGIGTGRNLGYYPEGVDRVVGLEPNAGMRKKLEGASRRASLRLEVVASGAEAMPFVDGRFETVVSTLSLCSIPDRAAALREMRRVMRPGGRLLLLEHGLSPDVRVARWQRRLNPIQRRFAAGCVLDVPVKEELQEAGFDVADLAEGYLEGESKTHGYLYRGWVTKA